MWRTIESTIVNLHLFELVCMRIMHFLYIACTILGIRTTKPENPCSVVWNLTCKFLKGGRARLHEISSHSWKRSAGMIEWLNYKNTLEKKKYMVIMIQVPFDTFILNVKLRGVSVIYCTSITICIIRWLGSDVIWLSHEPPSYSRNISFKLTLNS